ncbi:MAG: CorA family divalent cation transporter [Methanocellales archaeon]
MQLELTASNVALRLKLRESVNRLLSDHLMLVLALLLIPATILPFFFSFSQFMLVLFELINYIIIAVFAIEYFAKLYVADSRMAYALNPWHILDLFIVLLAAGDFLPFLPGGWRAAPMLRLLRVTRTFAIAGRTVKRAAPEKKVEVEVKPRVSRMKINILEENKVIRNATEAELYHYLATPAGTWVDFQEVSDLDLNFISDALKIPRYVLESKALEESFPRIDYFKDFTTIFIWDSKLQSLGIKDINISKSGMLIICANTYIATICTSKSELFDKVVSEGLAIKENEFIVGILYTIFKRKIKDYEEIVRVLEQKTNAMEEFPVGRAHPSFLEGTFQLKKEIQRIHNNLWHFKQVLDHVKSKKVALQGLKDEHLYLFDILYDESAYMFETSQNVKDSLISLIELHLNTVSFEMNKVMRVLAVITALALIPTIIGGLLGENLIDTPYPVTIFEIFFLVLSLMLLGGYAFYRRGWLR